MGQTLVLGNDERRAADVLAQALGELEMPDAVRSAILAWRSYAAASLGDLQRALDDAEEAARLADPLDQPEVLANAVTALVNAQVWLGRGLDRELIERGARPRDEVRVPLGRATSERPTRRVPPAHGRVGREPLPVCVAHDRRHHRG